MKVLTKLAAAAAVPALVLAAPASAQVTPDSDSFVVNLNGSVPSQCELLPNGSTDFTVDMTNTGNQGGLIIGYSCNSPYEVSLQSQNGGMSNTTSGGTLVIPYRVEGGSSNGPNPINILSTNMQLAPVPVIVETNWANILTNGGIAGGNLDLEFASLSDYAVAGDYEDTLTITLDAVW